MAWHDEILPLTAAPDGVVAPSPALSSSRSSARIGKARWSLLCLVAYALISFILIIRWESTASQCPVDLSTTSSYQRQQHFNNPDERPLLLPSDQCQPQRHRNGAVYLNSSDHCERFEHPIAILMREAEDKWKKMVDRQSRTLGEAVEEYRRRYGRSPPRGFDKWCAFSPLFSSKLTPVAQVVLCFPPSCTSARRVRHHPRIPRTILGSRASRCGVFLATTADINERRAVLRQRILDLRVFVHPSFLFMFNKGAVVRDDSADSDRTDGIRDHLPGLAPMIEDLTLTYFCGDESKMLVDWATREKHVEASKAGQIVDPVIGTYWDPTVPFDIKSACSPYSRVGEHLRYQDEDLPDVRSARVH